MRAVAIGLAVALFAAVPAFAKHAAKIPCQPVFVTGTQPFAIAWANKNLARDTDNCLVPVASPSAARAILVLRPDSRLTPPAAPPNPQPTSFWATCASAGGSINCVDADGNVLDVNCWPGGGGGVSCASYYGPNPVVAVSRLLYALTERHLARTVALGVLYLRANRHVLWHFDGAGVHNMFSVYGTWNGSIEASSACPKRWGTYGKYCKRAKRPRGIAAGLR